MPLAATGGFDTVLTVSNSSFEAILESRLLASLPPPPVGSNASISFNTPLGQATVTFEELSVKVIFPPAGGTSFTLYLMLLNARVQAPGINGSLGRGYAQVAIPASIVVTPAAGSVSVALSFDGAGVTLNTTTGADTTVEGARPLIENQLRANFAAFLAAVGLANPEPIGTAIPTVPVIPRAPIGTTPALSSLVIAALPRPGGAAGASQALAFCLTFQDMPDSPIGGSPPGAVGTIPPFALSPGADGALQLETAFVMELLTSVGLRPMLPGAAFIVSRAGIVMTAPIPLTVGGVAGTLLTFTVTPPAVPAAIPPVLTLAFTFVFVADSITYTITGGARLTLALAGSTLVVGVATTPATVTAAVPWWVVLGRIVGALLLFPLLPPDVAIANIVAAGTSAAIESSIVSAIATPLAAGATGGISSPSLPSALGSLLGSVGLTPPLSFDDLRFPTTFGSLAFAGTYRRADAESMSPTGESIDLESGVHRPFAGGAPVAGFGDLVWALAAGATPGPGARLTRLNGDFNAVSVTDVANALSAGSALSVPATAIPVVPPFSILPAPVVIGVRTNAGRLAKCALWQNPNGTLVLRYLVWDTRAAACRILPVATQWAQTDYVRDPDTPGPISTIVVKHERFAHSATFDVQATRVSAPVQVSWRLGSATLTGTGSIVVDGANIGFRRQASTVTLDVPLGASLQGAPLTVEVTDADGRFVTDTRVLTVAGARDTQYTPGIEDALGRHLELARDAVMRFRQSRLREQVDLPPLEDRPDVRDIPRALDQVWFGRLQEGGYRGSPDDVPIR